LPLTNVLSGMMQNSDNARAQAVTAYFGQGAINGTAATLGMTGTSLNHRMGCAIDALANPNRTTLSDLGRLHELVATGWLGNQREPFYAHMLQGLGTCAVDTIVAAEGAAAGLTTGQIAAFSTQARFVAKDGGYFLIDGTGNHIYSCSFGYLRVPRIAGTTLLFDEYVVGAFLDNGTNPTNADLARNKAVQELLRPTLRAALNTFHVTGSTTAFGSSCGPFQWASGLPRLGATTQYLTNGLANSFFLLGFGFSNTVWNGSPLPASLAPFGSQAGCNALCSVENTLTGISNGSGVVQVPIPLPASYAFLGFTYFTQYYALDTAQFRTSNGIRSVIGL
jgi:hypothetical protein